MKLPLKWEFPGGKIEVGETNVECIKREIKEELGIQIDILKDLTPVNYNNHDIYIQLIPFITRPIGGEIKLKEHKNILILKTEELYELDWAEADIPIVNEYINYKKIM